MRIVEFTIERYEEAYRFWSSIRGIGLSSADSREEITAFLSRNPGMSFLMIEDGMIVGSVLSGHDGRRGYLYHLAVDTAHRRHGIGELLVRKAVEVLRAAGIGKCHIFIFHENYEGKQFWRRIGFTEREDIGVFSHDLL